MAQRIYGGPLIDLKGAADIHFHSFPDVFPRLADDLEVARAARDAGMAALLFKCHHESTVSRAYLTQRAVGGIRLFGGIALNSYVGGINPAPVEVALRLGAKEVWMPTIDSANHARVHGGTGRYENQAGGRVTSEGISIIDDSGRLIEPIDDVLALVAEHNVILGTCHLGADEIFPLVRRARELGVEKIVITHPYFRVPSLDIEQVVELVGMGAMPEFAYCTVSPAWHYATVERVAETIKRVGASRCVLVSDAGQRHNPLPVEALRVFAQTLHEKGVPETDVRTMIADNPLDLLDVDVSAPLPDFEDFAWPAELAPEPDDGPAPTEGTADDSRLEASHGS